MFLIVDELLAVVREEKVLGRGVCGGETGGGGRSGGTGSNEGVF